MGHGGSRRVFCQVEPNFPLPLYSAVPGRRAGSTVTVQYMREYNAEGPKQAKGLK